MPMIKIDTYEVMYYSNDSDRRIQLKGSGKRIGQLLFLKNGTVLPKDSKGPEGHVNLYYHLEDFQNIMDLLRNESPLYLFYPPKFEMEHYCENGIRTNIENVGEGEI